MWNKMSDSHRLTPDEFGPDTVELPAAAEELADMASALNAVNVLSPVVAALILPT